MNTSALSKQYDKLTSWERYSLMVAAAHRNDEAERDRLERSAPRTSRLISHTHGLAHGMSLIADKYLMKQLDIITWYWRLEANLTEGFVFMNQRESQQHENRLEPLLKMFAHQFVVNAHGWKEFCDEIQVDPDALLRGYPGFDTIKDFDETARLLACSPEEALAFVRGKHGPDAEIETAESAAQLMRAELEFHREWWGLNK